MAWCMSLKLLPEEWIIDEGESTTHYGMMPEHTPIITNKRILFKYNTLSTGLVKSFRFDDVSDVATETRFGISYLKVTAVGRFHYMKVNDPEVWATKIQDALVNFLSDGFPKPEEPAASIDKSELLTILDRLHDAGLLTPEELSTKRGIVKGLT